MATKRYKELKSLSRDEMATRVRELRVELFQAKMKNTTGQLENPSSLWRMRKDLARLTMCLSQKVSR